MYITGRYLSFIGIGRIVIGIIFLWAGLEKLIGTPGGFSAAGFLQFGTNGTLGWPFFSGDPTGHVFNPTASFWQGLATNKTAMSVINPLVMYGEIAIGISLILGLLTRFAAAMGTLMMILFFFAAWDFAYGIVNQHLTYAVVTFGLGVIGAGNFYGLDASVGPMFPSGLRRWFFSGDRKEQTAAA